jgi:hypothetical protein
MMCAGAIMNGLLRDYVIGDCIETPKNFIPKKSHHHFNAHVAAATNVKVTKQ